MKRETQGKMKRPPEILPTATTAFILEAGCDEAGRGCLAGPVCAAAVILPDGYTNPLLNDSKKLTEHQREQLRPIIERDALAWGVGWATNEEIDDINILNASILAMHRALDSLGVQPGQIAVDGNRFKPYRDIRQDPPRRMDAPGCNTAPRLQMGSQQGIPHRRPSCRNSRDRHHPPAPTHIPPHLT